MTKLQAYIESIEILNAACSIPNSKENWESFEWSAGSGIAMESMSKNLHEMVIKRKPDQEYQTVLFKLF